MMSKQKYHKGDYVQVAKELGRSMSHFANDCEAIVMYSYEDLYGSGKFNSYGIFIKRLGTHSWYEEHQLTLIKSNQLILLKQWEEEKEEEANKKSDLVWIFGNGSEVIKSTHGATVAALAKCFGITNLWGSHGEGFTYYQNAIFTMELAKPYLEASDLDGWLEMCSFIDVKTT